MIEFSQDPPGSLPVDRQRKIRKPNSEKSLKILMLYVVVFVVLVLVLVVLGVVF